MTTCKNTYGASSRRRISSGVFLLSCWILRKQYVDMRLTKFAHKCLSRTVSYPPRTIRWFRACKQTERNIHLVQVRGVGFISVRTFIKVCKLPIKHSLVHFAFSIMGTVFLNEFNERKSASFPGWVEWPYYSFSNQHYKRCCLLRVVIHRHVDIPNLSVFWECFF